MGCLFAYNFDIKADGTNETEKINNLINEANDNPNISKVIFPPNATISIDNTVFFKNTKGCTVKFIGNNCTFKLIDDSLAFNNHVPMASIEGENIDFSGFKFDGNYEGNFIIDGDTKRHSFLGGDGNSVGDTTDNKGSIALLIGGKNVKIHNCTFNDISWSCCDLYGVEDAEIYDNTFINSSQDYIPIHSSTRVNVHDNLLLNPQHDAIHAYTLCSNITINNNTIKWNKDMLTNNKYYDEDTHRPSPSYVGIELDHSGYFQSEVEWVKVRENTIISELDSEDFIKKGEGFFGHRAINIIGYPKNFKISGNKIDLKDGCCIFMDSPNLGGGYITDNILYTDNQYVIRYRLDKDHNDIDYDTDRFGSLIIRGNTVNNPSGVMFYASSKNTDNILDKYMICFENNIYNNIKNMFNLESLDDPKLVIKVNEKYLDFNLIRTDNKSVTII